MAYYNYKVVRDLIPDDFRQKYEEDFLKETGDDFVGDANYDGDLWLLTAAYIEHLLDKIKTSQ